MAHRFFVPPERLSEDRVALTEEQQKQIRNVLRLQAGDAVVVFDGSGREFRVEIQYADRGVTGTVVSQNACDTEPFRLVTLVQGLPKGEKIDLVLQKCTEIGVSEFLIVETARCVARIPSEKVPGRLERWRAIVREASEQSGRACLPLVKGVFSFKEALSSISDRGRLFIAWESEKATTLSSEIARMPGNERVCILIGPEGGFTPEEVDAARQIGATPVSLGPRILRTETAGIVAATLLIYS